MAAFKYIVSNSSCEKVKKKECYSTERECSGYFRMKKEICKQLPRGVFQNRSSENFRKFPEIFCEEAHFLVKLEV